MKAERGQLAITALKLTVGLVVLAESLRLALAHEGYFVATHPLLHQLRPVLAWSEAAAAVLYLIPLTTFAGGSALLVIFLTAAVLHMFHGEMNIGGLLVNGAAVLAILMNREEKS